MATSKKVVPLAERTDPFADMTDDAFAKDVRSLYESWQLVVRETTRRGITIHGRDFGFGADCQALDWQPRD